MEEQITYKKCSKCGEEKPATPEYFAKHKQKKDGLYNYCKFCVNKINKEYYKNNRNKIIEASKKYCEENPDKKKQSNKKYRKKNKDKIIEYRKKNKTKTKVYNKKYYQENRQKLIENTIEYQKDKLKNDNTFYVWETIRQSLRSSFKRMKWSKKTKTQDYLKCDWETFKKHIENQFTDGMTWDNHGEWHYDHYYPVSLAQTEEDMYIFNHYTNFQPLWAEDNLSKNNKVPDGFEEWYEMMKKKVL